MPAWMDRALCASFHSMPWIGEPEDRSTATTRAMAAVCSACPVEDECARYVEAGLITSGFWAGRDRTPETQLEDGAA